MIDRKHFSGTYSPAIAVESIPDLLHTRAEQTPDSEAVLAPGQNPLTYRRLWEQTEKVARVLNSLGMGRQDRIAIVLPGGPESAVAFLCIASGATAAPLNPAYSAEEFEFFLKDLNAKALVIQAGADSPAGAVAEACGVQIITLSLMPDAEAGIFELTGGSHKGSPKHGFSRPGDVALILHTSGTTSRPKMVPLTQANVCVSGRNICNCLKLQREDRCLNIMPLFHVHGLMGGLLASLTGGAGVICVPGFSDEKFLEWVKAFRPTWYTAVPAMHQAILARAEDDPVAVERASFRLIRSCSSPLPQNLMDRLEKVFKAPVIEAYGMTEACHQITSNPLPPGERKPGSVGIGAASEVAVMDEKANRLATDEIGEIVIRGPNVMSGYENNPEANDATFTGGWFRTGDQGYLDGDGYLFIVGRLKELINRGGEKIAPREVDETLMKHPAVAQAVAFAVPHERLGEDAVAAVVLKKNADVTEREIRDFLLGRLADYKVPSQIVIVDEIPKGPTGKVQRIGLADKLAPVLRKQYEAPRNEVEETLAAIWAEVLGVEKVGVNDNFFALGGDSLLATRLMSRLYGIFQIDVPIKTIFGDPTLGGQALMVEEAVLEKIENLSEEEAERLNTENWRRSQISDLS